MITLHFHRLLKNYIFVCEWGGCVSAPELCKVVEELNAKEFLLQVRKYDYLIQNRLEEICMLKEKAKMLGSVSIAEEKVCTSKNVDIMQDALVDYVQQEEKLKEEIAQCWEKRAEVIEYIDKLGNIEYDLLHKVYVQGKTLYEVAYMNDRTYSWATTVHGRALKNLQAILDAA